MKRILSICLAALFCAAPISLVSAQSPQEIMNKFSHEPTVEETMEAAVSYSGLDGDRLESMYRRAGAANALPKSIYYEFQGRYQDTDRPQKVYTFDDTKKAEADEWSSYKKTNYHQDQDYTQHKVHAQWDLSKLIYNSEQKAVVGTMVSASTRRDKILKDLTKVYYQRRKAQIDAILNPPSDIAKKLESDLKIQELTATLDAMTGGWFSEQLRNNRH